MSFLAPSPRPEALGRLGHYDVLGTAGRGGMGVVLRAADEKLQRVVAIKVMALELAASATARKRFIREARAAAAVCHEHVVTIHAVEEEHSPPYFVMQFVEGVSLQDKLDRTGPLELREILRIGLQMAEGLAAAHKQGLIHRDVKPANILLENGVERVKITDFGLARAVDDASVTQSGIIAGTPLYISPEQAEGQHLDQRSDLFSLGSVLYALCTGRAPFRASTRQGVLNRVCEGTPRPNREINPDIPDWLCALIARLHAKMLEARFPTAAEVAAVLAEQLAALERLTSSISPPTTLLPASGGTYGGRSGEPSRISLTRPAGPTTFRKRRQRWLVAAAIGLVLLAGLGMMDTAGVTHLAGTVIRLLSPQGTLLVEVEDPGVSVTLDGAELIITGTGTREIRLRPGQHRIQASKDGKLVRQELVTITNHGRQVVRVSREVDGKLVEPSNGADVSSLLTRIQREQHRTALALSRRMAANRIAALLNPQSGFGVLPVVGAPAATEAAYRKAIELQPDNARFHYNLGILVGRQGKLVEAIAAYRKDAELDPDFAQAYISLGRDLQNHEGKWTEAEAAYRKAIEKNRQFQPKAYYDLGTTLALQRRWVEAEAAFRKAIDLKLDSNIGHANSNLGQALKEQGRFTEALIALKRSHELGRITSQWPDPYDDWVREVERLIELNAGLSRLLNGQRQPGNLIEYVEVAQLCEYRQLHAASTRFYEKILADDDPFADELAQSLRYDSACTAALAGCGQAHDAPVSEDEERARLRRLSLDWLQTTLTAWQQRRDKNPDNGTFVSIAKTMRRWLNDSAFNGVRGGEALAHLPASERADWQQLWTNVEPLWQRIQAQLQ